MTSDVRASLCHNKLTPNILQTAHHQMMAEDLGTSISTDFFFLKTSSAHDNPVSRKPSLAGQTAVKNRFVDGF